MEAIICFEFDIRERKAILISALQSFVRQGGTIWPHSPIYFIPIVFWKIHVKLLRTMPSDLAVKGILRKR